MARQRVKLFACGSAVSVPLAECIQARSYLPPLIATNCTRSFCITFLRGAVLLHLLPRRCRLFHCLSLFQFVFTFYRYHFTVLIFLFFFHDTHTFPSICLIWKPAVVASCWGAHGSGEIVLVFMKQCKSVLCGYGAVQMYSSNANCAMRRLFVSLCEYISRIKRLLQQKVQSMRSAGNDAGTDWGSNEFLVLLTKWCRRGDRQSYCGKMFVAFPSLSHC